MQKEVQRLKEHPEHEIHQDSLKATLQKVPRYPGYDGILGFWF